jgi:hypothetical protein
MKNIQLIPTKDKGRITKHNKELHIEKIAIYNEPSIKMEVFNMYITSDEEVKEGDWYCSPYGIISKHNGTEMLPDYWRKIILTTDQDLIKDGIQPINDEFLEWFVKNPSCEEVEIGEGVRYEDEWIDNEDGGEIFQHQYCSYKIIIPKEEHILEEAKQRAANYMSLKGALDSQYVDFSNPNADKITSTSTTSFKQETIEEAAKRIYGSDVSKDVEYYAFLNGANWQAERMYSEEEMISFMQFIISQETLDNTSSVSKETAKYYLEQFKKK